MSRRSWLIAGLTTPLFFARAAEALEVKYDGDNLHVTAPNLRFLIGKPLERLKDGLSVAYIAQFTLFNDDHVTVVKRHQGRFVVSQDVWGEKFSVRQLGALPRSVDGLSATAAEAWCLESLAISTLGLEPDRMYWLRFELATADQKDVSGVTDEPGLSLRKLVDYFGRKPKEDEPHWAPLERRLRLSDLPRMTGRGRIG